MSRFATQTGEGTTIVYGFDHVLGYFYEEYIDDSGKPAQDCCTAFGTLSRGKLLDLLEEVDVPYKHREAIAADLPF